MKDWPSRCPFFFVSNEPDANARNKKLVSGFAAQASTKATLTIAADPECLAETGMISLGCWITHLVVGTAPNIGHEIKL